MRRISIALAAALVSLIALGQKPDAAEVELKAAMHKEQVDGDLKGAIAQYQKLLATRGVSRAVTAQALLHLGQCHEKLGNAEARKAYERLVMEFSDQREVVAEAQARLSALRTTDRSALTVRKVYTGETYGAPSPDGRYFTCRIEDDLATCDPVTGERRRLTSSPSGEFSFGSEPSPDGKLVAYEWYPNGEVYELRVIGLDGAAPRVLYRNDEVAEPDPADWSPDGKSVLAVLNRKDKTSQMVLVSVADGSVRVLKTSERDSPGRARISPDGRYVAYDFPQQPGSEERDIFLLALDSGREIPLVQHAANDVEPDWTPDGKRIVFRSNRTGSVGLWSVQVAEGKPLGSPELIKQDMGNFVAMGFTRQGAYYYRLRTSAVDVYTAELDLETGKVVAGPSPVTQRFVGSNNSPDWSPDGRQLVFLSQRGPGVWGARVICILTVETGEVRELSPKTDRLSWIRWSPDGRSFFVMASTSEGYGLHRIDIQTGESRPVARDALGFAAVWSRDSKGIIYLSKDERMLMRELETGEQKELHRVPPPSFYCGGPVLSRDGRQFAFLVAESGSTVLKVMPATGGEARDLLRLKGGEAGIDNGRIVWAPDGLNVLFIRGGALWRISAQGGEPQKLGPMNQRARDMSFHPDGRRVAFAVDETTMEVWVMENLLPAAQRY